MKLRTRLVIAFFTIILIPILLSGTMILALGKFSLTAIEKTYGIQGTSVETLSSSVQILSRVTGKYYDELINAINSDVDDLQDATWLEDFNTRLEEKGAYLLVRKEDTIIYMGEEGDHIRYVIEELPEYAETETSSDNGMYLGGEAQVMVKQIDFSYKDGMRGSAFIVVDVGSVIPEVEAFLVDMAIGIAVALVITALILVFWIYRSDMQPLAKMQVAAKNF